MAKYSYTNQFKKNLYDEDNYQKSLKWDDKWGNDLKRSMSAYENVEPFQYAKDTEMSDWLEGIKNRPEFSSEWTERKTNKWNDINQRPAYVDRFKDQMDANLANAWDNSIYNSQRTGRFNDVLSQIQNRPDFVSSVDQEMIDNRENIKNNYDHYTPELYDQANSIINGLVNQPAREFTYQDYLNGAVQDLNENHLITPEYLDEIRANAAQYASMGPYQRQYADKMAGLRDDIENNLLYESQWKDDIDTMTNRMMQDYDPNQDIMYDYYRQAYERGGQQAMKNASAQAAALSGGYGSSYANSIGQQTYNQYMSALTDKIPELARAAQDMYGAKLNALYEADNHARADHNSNLANRFQLYDLYNTEENRGKDDWNTNRQYYLDNTNLYRDMSKDSIDVQNANINHRLNYLGTLQGLKSDENAEAHQNFNDRISALGAINQTEGLRNDIWNKDRANQYDFAGLLGQQHDREWAKEIADRGDLYNQAELIGAQDDREFAQHQGNFQNLLGLDTALMNHSNMEYGRDQDALANDWKLWDAASGAEQFDFTRDQADLANDWNIYGAYERDKDRAIGNYQFDVDRKGNVAGMYRDLVNDTWDQFVDRNNLSSNRFNNWLNAEKTYAGIQHDNDVLNEQSRQFDEDMNYKYATYNPGGGGGYGGGYGYDDYYDYADPYTWVDYQNAIQEAQQQGIALAGTAQQIAADLATPSNSSQWEKGRTTVTTDKNGKKRYSSGGGRFTK